MLFRIKSYLNFLRNLQSASTVNSPFISDFISQCLIVKPTSQQTPIHQRFRKNLLNNTSTIRVTDFGAGSKVFKSNERKVSKIAKHAGISTKRATLLHQTTTFLKPKHVLEIGTSLGLGTAALYLGHSAAKITSLEGCPETAKIAKEQFKQFDCSTINVVVGDFKHTLPKVLQQSVYDLIYFDGNHQKEATLHYFELALSATHNNTVLIFDDIHWSTEMTEAWNTIKIHPKVSTTIDTFQWGIVFLNPELPKQKLTIRV